MKTYTEWLETRGAKRLIERSVNKLKIKLDNEWREFDKNQPKEKREVKPKDFNQLLQEAVTRNK